MTKYREILRLASLGLGLKCAKELQLNWLLEDTKTDAVFVEKLFPSVPGKVTSLIK